jgi:transcriptional regulator with XRE-family HTH domain
VLQFAPSDELNFSTPAIRPKRRIMKLTPDLSDAAVLQELGIRLERRRLDANLTQAELADQAGISKRTLERIEAGHSTDAIMLIRALRTLQLFAGLESLVPDLPPSPLTLLKQRGRERQRVGRRRQATAPPSGRKPPHPWKWGE